MKPVEIAPSILSCDFADMGKAVDQLLQAGCERIHLDVMDGQFVPPITFGAKMAADLNKGKGFFEAHLMTQTPERHFDAFVKAGCKGIMFHQEAAPHAHRLLQQLRDMGVQAGIAINPGTSVAQILPLLKVADLVLIMTVNPGWGGQAFIESCVDKVRQVRDVNATIDVEVDGGIDPQTIGRVREAGANVFVAGSFLVQQSSLAEGVQMLRAACD